MDTTVNVQVLDAPRPAAYEPASDLTEVAKRYALPLPDDADSLVESYKSIQSGPLTQAQAPNAFVSDYETVQAFALAGALAPPEDPRQVANVYRRSSALRPCVEAIATNVCGFGYTFEPVVDLAKADAGERIHDALLQDRVAQGNDTEPTDADVAECRAMIEHESLRERWKLQRFFDFCCPTMDFTQLRWETRVEIESGGNGFWEVTRQRDGTGGIATVDRIEAHTMRLRRTEQRYFFVERNQRRSPLSYERAAVPMRFRTYCQLVLGGAKVVYYKQYGDPRVLSSVTGRFYATQALLQASEPGSPAATEIVHWRAFDTIGPYGIPRWYAAQYGVMGMMASERVNYDYFDQKAIPPFAIFVSGGKLAADATAKLQDLMKSVKGQAQFWKILVLEASSSSETSKCRIELHPLLTAMPEDALFQQYEANNAKKIQQQWRLPDLLVGRSQEANRAQAEAALQMAEQQVMQPLRGAEDDFYNRFWLPEMGVRFWRFKTNSAVARDPQLQTDIGTAWGKAGALTPNEMRSIAADVLNDPTIQPIDEPWANIPQPLMLAGIMPGLKDGVAQPVPAQAGTLAQQLIATREVLRRNAEQGAVTADAAARAGEAVKTVKVDPKTWKSLWAQ